MKAHMFPRPAATPRRWVAIVILLMLALLSPLILSPRAQAEYDLDDDLKEELELSIRLSKKTVNVGEFVSVTVDIENDGETARHLYVFIGTPDAINPIEVKQCPGEGSVNYCDLGEFGPDSETEIRFIVQPVYKSPNGPLTAFLTDADTFETIAQVSAPLLKILGPPEIGYDPGPLAKEITQTSAVIVWTTDDRSSSLVRYGLTETYGQTKSTSKLVTYHKVKLTGLQHGTTYHFQVESTDRDGTTAGFDQIFTTAP